MDEVDEGQAPASSSTLLLPLLQQDEHEGRSNAGKAGEDAMVHGQLNQAPSWSCVAVLASTMLGAGVIGGPHAMALLGSCFGCCLLLLSVFFSANGLYLLSLSAHTTGVRPTSFYTLCLAAIPRWTFVVDLAIATKCFGVAVSYLIVVGDLMPLAAQQFQGHDGGLLTARWFWVTVSFLTTIPLTFLRSLTALKYTSSISVTFVVALAIVCLLYASGTLEPCGSDATGGSLDPTASQTCRGVRVGARWSMDALEALPVYIFAFTCHQNFVCLVNELERPTRPRILLTIAWATGIACVTNLIIGEAAYATYGSVISSDILATFPGSTLSTVLRSLISILVTFAFPLQAHPARSCLLALVRQVADKETSHRHLQARFYIITTAFLVLAYLVALSVKDLGVMLEVVGATGSTTVSYLLPGITYYMLHPKPHLRRYLALTQFLLGCLIIPTCLTITVRKHTR